MTALSDPISIAIQRLEVRNLRNLESVDLEPSASTNVLYGDNGQGKTSLLEAVYLAATTRSFRTHRLRELIRHGSPGGSVRVCISDPLGAREQLVGLASGQRMVKLDGQKQTSLAQYAVRTPVVVFHPGELTLTMGPASGRRTLIDRVALFTDPQSHVEQQAYTRAMRTRQRMLQSEGPMAPGVDAYERLMVVHGVALTRYRREAVDRLITATRDAFERMAPSSLRMSGRYAAGGSEDESAATERLLANREKDGRRSGADFGPHRDELVLELNDRRVRSDASQGQHRLLTLSLKIAEMVCVGASSGTKPLLLLDDVSSELDAERTDAFFDLLGCRTDQVFLTTTRPEMLPLFERAMGGAKVFEVDSGCVAAIGS